MKEIHPDRARELGGAQMHSPEAQEQLRSTIEDAKRTLSLHDSGKMKLPRHVVDALGALVAGAGDASQPGLPLGKDKGHFEEAAKPAFLDLDKDGDKEEPMKDAADNVEESLNENDGIAMSIDGVFAPSHYCVHHGGVEHNGSTQMAEAVSHNYNEELDRVTHYDMKLKDGTILENVAFEDIQVTNASLAEGHNHPMKRDDDEEEEEKKKDLDALGADIAGAQSGVNEETEEVNEDSETKEVNEDSEEINEESEEEETLNEWKNNTLYKKLLKEYTKR